MTTDILTVERTAATPGDQPEHMKHFVCGIDSFLHLTRCISIDGMRTVHIYAGGDSTPEFRTGRELRKLAAQALLAAEWLDRPGGEL
jgi:hypothetical protein